MTSQIPLPALWFPQSPLRGPTENSKIVKTSVCRLIYPKWLTLTSFNKTTQQKAHIPRMLVNLLYFPVWDYLLCSEHSDLHMVRSEICLIEFCLDKPYRGNSTVHLIPPPFLTSHLRSGAMPWKWPLCSWTYGDITRQMHPTAWLTPLTNGPPLAVRGRVERTSSKLYFWRQVHITDRGPLLIPSSDITKRQQLMQVQGQFLHLCWH